jgi:hypothetical protein
MGFTQFRRFGYSGLTMAKNPNKPIAPTKKHLARLEKERRQTQYIMIGAAVVVVSVLFLIIYGILNQTVLADRRPVAVVNGEPIRSSQFVEQARYVRYVMIRNAENTYQMAQYFGQDPSMAQNFVQQLQQVQAQLNPQVMGNQVMDTIVDDLLIRQEAEKLGITVTDAEVDQAFQAAFGYYPDGTPTPSATLEIIPTSTLSAFQLTMVPPTPTETVTPTLTSDIPPRMAPGSLLRQQHAACHRNTASQRHQLSHTGTEPDRHHYADAIHHRRLRHADRRHIYEAQGRLRYRTENLALRDRVTAYPAKGDG